MNLENPDDPQTYLIELGNLKPFEQATWRAACRTAPCLSSGRPVKTGASSTLQKNCAFRNWFSNFERIHRQAVGMR